MNRKGRGEGWQCWSIKKCGVKCIQFIIYSFINNYVNLTTMHIAPRASGGYKIRGGVNENENGHIFISVSTSKDTE